MNVQLSNDEYVKLAQIANSRGQLTADTAADLIRERLGSIEHVPGAPVL